MDSVNIPSNSLYHLVRLGCSANRCSSYKGNRSDDFNSASRCNTNRFRYRLFNCKPAPEQKRHPHHERNHRCPIHRHPPVFAFPYRILEITGDRYNEKGRFSLGNGTLPFALSIKRDNTLLQISFPPDNTVADNFNEYQLPPKACTEKEKVIFACCSTACDCTGLTRRKRP